MAAYAGPRFAKWLQDCKGLGMSTELVRPERGNRGFFASCLSQKRTVTEDAAFSVGQRIARTERYAQFADGIVALYAAGYMGAAATCLQRVIERALIAYPHRAKITKLAIIDDRRPKVVRPLTYALTAAVSIPYALAHLDGIPDSIISSAVRAEHLALVTSRSNAAHFESAWDSYVAERTQRLQARVRKRVLSETVDIANRETQAWTAFVNGLSLKAQEDPILQLHFSMMRPTVDEYQRIRYAVPHPKPDGQHDGALAAYLAQVRRDKEARAT